MPGPDIFLMQFLKILAVFLLFTGQIQAQEKINVSQQMVKVAPLSEEVLYFSFAGGDRITINISEKNGRRMSIIEVSEYPLNTKYQTTKIAQVKIPEMNIPSEGIYVVKLRNNTITGRECSLSIDRIPLNEDTRHFNTSVRWVTVNDTTWKSSFTEGIIRYDTLYSRTSSQGVVYEEIIEEYILDKTQRVRARTVPKASKTQISFSLPPDIINEKEEKTLLSWAYWIGVDEAGNEAWEHNSKVISEVIKGGVSFFLSPLAALAIGAVSDLSIPTMGEDVDYYLTEDEVKFARFKKTKFDALDKGKGVAGYQRFGPDENRDFNLVLQNDNLLQGIDVNVKVVAVYQYKRFGKVTDTEMEVKPVRGKVQERTPIIKTIKVPVRME